MLCCSWLHCVVCTIPSETDISTSSSIRGPVPEPEKKLSDQNGKSEHAHTDTQDIARCTRTHTHTQTRTHTLTFNNTLCLTHVCVACRRRKAVCMYIFTELHPSSAVCSECLRVCAYANTVLSCVICHMSSISHILCSQFPFPFPDDGSCMLPKHWTDSSQLASVCKTFDISKIPGHSRIFKSTFIHSPIDGNTLHLPCKHRHI